MCRCVGLSLCLCLCVWLCFTCMCSSCVPVCMYACKYLCSCVGGCGCVCAHNFFLMHVCISCLPKNAGQHLLLNNNTMYLQFVCALRYSGNVYAAKHSSFVCQVYRKQIKHYSRILDLASAPGGIMPGRNFESHVTLKKFVLIENSLFRFRQSKHLCMKTRTFT